MGSGKVLLGVMAGIAAGTLLGVLIAPDKGSETRRKILKKGTDAMDGISDKLDEVLATVGDKLLTSKAQFDNALEKGKNKVENNKNEFKSSLT